MGAIFREQGQRLRLPQDLSAGEAALSALDARWAKVTRATAQPATSALAEALKAAYAAGAKRLVNELAAVSEAITFRGPPVDADEIPLDDLGHAVLDGTSFSVDNPRAVKFLDGHAAALVRGIDEATRKTMRSIVTNGVAAGKSSQKIGQDITARFNQMAVGKPQLHINSRAHGIAVTEMAFGYEAGQRDVANKMSDVGIDVQKSWLTVGDGRVDDLCAGNAGEGWITKRDNFSSGDAAPPAHPYCRCTALYRTAREQEQPPQPAAQPAITADDEPTTAVLDLILSPSDEAREEWLEGKPESVREWLETSDEPEARIARLDLGETPELEDTLGVWQISSFGEIRASAATGLETIEGQEIWHHAEMAEQLIGEVATGPEAPALFRGIAVDRATAASWEPGDTVDMNLSSWSSVEGFAASHGQEYQVAEQPVLVVFNAAPGARGVELAATITDHSAEWITQGRFEVEAVIPFPGDPSRVDVYLRQEAVFTSPDQFADVFSFDAALPDVAAAPPDADAAAAAAQASSDAKAAAAAKLDAEFDAGVAATQADIAAAAQAAAAQADADFAAAQASGFGALDADVVSPEDAAAIGAQMRADAELFSVAEQVDEGIADFNAQNGKTSELTQAKQLMETHQMLNLQGEQLRPSDTHDPDSPEGQEAFLRHTMTVNALAPSGVPDNVIRVALVDDLAVAGAINYDLLDRDTMAAMGMQSGQPETVHINFLGATGLAKGTGSALTADAIQAAAEAGVGVSLQPLDEAIPFWEKMGMTESPWVDPEGGLPQDGPLFMAWGMTADDVKSVAAGLDTFAATSTGPAPTGGRVFASGSEVDGWAEGWRDTKDVDPDSTDSLRAYSGTDYVVLNAWLRDGRPDVDADPGGPDPEVIGPFLQSSMEGIDAAMEFLPHDIVAYRGVHSSDVYGSTDAEIREALRPGSEHYNSGFTSTSLLSDQAAQFGDVLWRLELDEDVKAVFMDDELSFSPEEHELLLQRGLTRVVDRLDRRTIPLADGRSYKGWIVDAHYESPIDRQLNAMAADARAAAASADPASDDIPYPGDDFDQDSPAPQL